MNKLITSAELTKHKIKIHEPFAEFLSAGPDEIDFELSLLDVVRFAGHACPAMVGAFLMSKVATEQLFSDGVCIRGDVRIDVRFGPAQGATGPIANVFGFITGAWSETGFGGFQGKFLRRHLLKFSSEAAKANGYRFTRISSGEWVDLHYDQSKIQIDVVENEPFQTTWRKKIASLLSAPEKYILCEKNGKAA